MLPPCLSRMGLVACGVQVMPGWWCFILLVWQVGADDQSVAQGYHLAIVVLSPPRRGCRRAAEGGHLLGGRTKLTTDQACVRQRSSVLSYPLRKTVIFRSLTTVVALAHHAWFLVTWVTYKRRPPCSRHFAHLIHTNNSTPHETPDPLLTGSQLYHEPTTTLPLSTQRYRRTLLSLFFNACTRFNEMLTPAT